MLDWNAQAVNDNLNFHDDKHDRNQEQAMQTSIYMWALNNYHNPKMHKNMPAPESNKHTAAHTSSATHIHSVADLSARVE